MLLGNPVDGLRSPKPIVKPECNSVRTLVWNHGCSHGVDLSTIGANLFRSANFCHLQHLDLSCSLVDNIEPGALDPITGSNDNDPTRSLTIDLNDNRLSDFGVVAKSIAHSHTTKMIVNLDNNPIRVWNQSQVEQFLAKNENIQVSAWHSRASTRLDCQNCVNHWIRGNAKVNIDGFCYHTENATGSILIKQAFSHCP